MAYDICLMNEVQPLDYLKTLISQYPFDIEEALVLTLLEKHTVPHPSLLRFIAYFADTPLYHLYTKEIEIPRSMQRLWQRMAHLHQVNQSALHTHHFAFQAGLKLKYHRIANPYGHLPLNKIPFLSEAIIHTPGSIHTASKYADRLIKREHHFIFRDLSMDPKMYIAVSIRIFDKYGIIYIPRHLISMALALSHLFVLCSPPSHIDFMCIYGYRNKKSENVYYYDETNDLMIGFISGQEEIECFDYVKAMILTLYNTICIEKHDLPIQGAMFQATKGNTHFGCVLIGEAGSGKSELLEAMRKRCVKEGYDFQCVFDDMGTLHYLDNDIYATGTMIASYVRLQDQRQPYLLKHLSESMLVNCDDIHAHALIPNPYGHNVFQFHRVNACFYLNNYDMLQEVVYFDDKRDALEVFERGRCLVRGKPHDGLQDVYFANPYGIVQSEDASAGLIDEFFNVMYVNNITMGELYTKMAYDEYRTRGIEDSVDSLMKIINTQ